MSDNVIHFENVCKQYTLCHHFSGGIKVFLFNLPQVIKQWRANTFESLIDVNFTISRGESVGIIGPNGAGKSTALGLIAGVLRPNSGRITVNGRVSPLLELGAGFHPDLTGRENIMLNGVLMGMTRKEVRGKMGQIIDFAELGQFIEEPVRTYSTGMMARLGFSVVAYREAEILLIDEILAVGDVHFQAKCAERMHRFKRNGATIILVSHSVDAVADICERAIWLDQGRVRMQGDARSVGQAYVQHML